MAEQFDNPSRRRAWLRARRAGPDGALANGQFLAASQQRHHRSAKELEAAALFRPPGPSTSNNWTPLGPSVILGGQATDLPRVSGRITALAVGTSGQRVYAGAANGGVWLFVGDIWRPLDEFAFVQPTISGRKADSLSVGALNVRFGGSQKDDEIFVGTGEPGSDGYFGVGIKHSVDGGQTFTLEAPELASVAFYKIARDALQPDLVFAATEQGLYQRAYQPPGPTWSKVAIPGLTPSNRAATDVVIAAAVGAQPRTIYAAFRGFVAGSTQTAGSVYASTDDGANWTLLSGVSADGRIALAVSSKDPTVVYALAYTAPARQDNVPLLFRRDTSNNGVFRGVSGVPSNLFGTQGHYDIVVAVDPWDADAVYVAGAAVKVNGQYNLGFWGCKIIDGTSLGPSLTAAYIGTGIHADAHALAFGRWPGGAEDSNQIWVGTDGGPFRSMLSGANGSFEACNNGLNITQLTYIADRPDTDAVIYAGCQDNGTIRTFGDAAWHQSYSGDGGGVAVDPRIAADPAAPIRVMRQYHNAALSRCGDGGIGTWERVPFPPAGNDIEDSRTGFYGPIRAVEDGTSTCVAFGTNRLWISGDWGTTWVTLPTANNPLASTVPNLTQDVLDDCTPTIKAGESGSQEPIPIVALTFASASKIFAATAISVRRFDSSGGTWTSKDIQQPSSPVFPITSIAVEDTTQGSFYIGIGGSSVDHIWYNDGSTDDGTNWKSAQLLLADFDAPVNCLVVDPKHSNVVYAGSDVGVWKGTKTIDPTTGSNWAWEVYSAGLPECSIVDLTIHAGARLLRAATHGRGAWEIALDTNTGVGVEIFLRTNYADSGRIDGSTSKRFAWIDTARDPATPTQVASRWNSPDIKVSPIGSPLPRLPLDYVTFAELPATSKAASTGTKFFVQFHARGTQGLLGFRVWLLVASATATPPNLPADFAARITAGDTTDWLGSTGWKFADPQQPYAETLAVVSARTPQIVSFNVDLGKLGITGTVFAAAFAYRTGTGPGPTAPVDLASLLQSNNRVACAKFEAAPGTWQDAGPMVHPRSKHSATLLNSGKVIVTGGQGATMGLGAEMYDRNSNSFTAFPGDFAYSVVTNLDNNSGKTLVTRSGSATANVYDFDSDTSVSTTGSKPGFYYLQQTAMRRDGSVYLIGASSRDGPVYERQYLLYNPSTNNFWYASPPVTGRSQWFTAISLADGGVLAVGGPYSDGRTDLMSLELYDPARFGRGDDYVRDVHGAALPRADAFTMTVLLNGLVLIAGGRPLDLTAPLNTVCLFNTDLFVRTSAASMLESRFGHTATLLDNGKVLVTGGWGAGAPLNTVELYDPLTDTWHQGPSMMSARADHTATKLDDGRVLVAGGIQSVTLPNIVYAPKAEIYDPSGV